MIKISIATQKGGAGKSTLTCCLANKLCFQHNAKVLIVDCDPQPTIFTNWRAESALFETIKTKKRNQEPLEKKETAWAKEFEKTNFHGLNKINVVYIEDSRIKGDFRKLDSIIKNYDVVLYDLPGNLKDLQLLHEMLTFDYIFIPVGPDYSSGVKSTATAAALSILKKRLQNTKENPKIYLFFNMVNVSSAQHREEMVELYTAAAKKGFDFLAKPDGTPLFIDMRVLYQNYLTRSLLVDTHLKLRYSKADIVLQDMLRIIGYEGTQESKD